MSETIKVNWVDGNVILWCLMILILYIVWESSKLEFIYTVHSYQCLRCNYKYESKSNRLMSLVMFYHRIVCRGK